MKKFLLFPLLVFMTAIVIPACSDDEEEIFTPETSDSTGIGGGDTINNDPPIEHLKKFIYIGTITVNGTYKQDSIVCQMTYADENNLTLDMLNVKFAENMPMPISLTIPQIPYTIKGMDDIIFSGDSIVPMMGIIPAQAFMFETINGSIEYKMDKLYFNATISGRGKFIFSGRIKDIL